MHFLDGLGQCGDYFVMRCVFGQAEHFGSDGASGPLTPAANHAVLFELNSGSKGA
jgi:hypothetical protein